MIYPLLIQLQYVLAVRRNSDDGGWMQLLILVVMAIVYGLATIIRAKSAGRELEADEQLEEALREETVQKPRPIKRPAKRVEQRRPGRPISPAKPVIEEPLQAQLGAEIIGESEKITTESLPPLKQEMPHPLKLRQLEQKPAPGQTIGLDDPESLRKAIVHREILGKPLGLRDM